MFFYVPALYYLFLCSCYCTYLFTSIFVIICPQIFVKLSFCMNDETCTLMPQKQIFELRSTLHQLIFFQ